MDWGPSWTLVDDKHEIVSVPDDKLHPPHSYHQFISHFPSFF